jgi:hypothetical protein
MNERIKQLEIQSVFYNEDTQLWEFDREKFAELLVEECLSILKESQEHYANPIKCEPAEDYVEYYIAMSAKEYAIADAISDIKYRFEVEE